MNCTNKFLPLLFGVCLLMLPPVKSHAQTASTVTAQVQSAQALWQAERFPEAQAVLAAALKTHPAPADQKALKIAVADMNFQWALALWFKQQKYDEALAHAQAALAIDRILRPANAADEMNKLGQGLHLLHRDKEAIAYFEQARQIDHQLGAKTNEAAMLIAIGVMYQELSRYDVEMRYLNQALPLAQAKQDHLAVAWILGALGSAQLALSHYEEAIKDSQAALEANQAALGQPVVGTIGESLSATYGGETRTSFDNLEGTMIGNLGAATFALGRYDQAVAYYEQSLALSRKSNDQEAVAVALANLGSTYQALGSLEKAADYLEQALTALRGQEFNQHEETLLANLADVHHALGREPEAQSEWQQALTLARRVKDRAEEGSILTSMGVAAIKTDPAGAVVFLKQGLAIAREVGSGTAEANALKYLGAASLRTQPGQATAYGQQALEIEREAKSQSAEAETLTLLMIATTLQKKPRLAIFYGKQAVNSFQALRGNIRSFDQDTQKTFVNSRADVYRLLAALLIQQGRLPEAQQVLGLLKQDEFFSFVQRDAQQSPASGHADLTTAEADWQTRYSQIADQITALGAERGVLRANTARTPAQEARLTQLNTDLQVARQRFAQFLTQLASALGAAPNAGDKVKTLQDAVGMQTDLRRLGPGTVALYTLVGEDKFRVLIVTADTQKAEEYPITAAALRAKVARFQSALQDPTADPRPLAQELYTILFCNGAVANDLDGAGATTLMWSLDDVLRYLPMAALYDGKQYLVERYRNTVFTPVSNARLKDPVSPHWKGLGLGVSKAHDNFPALPGAAAELHGIIGGPGTGEMPGSVDLDEAFTKDSMETALGQGYPLVHIASHFQFAPGNETASYLLLGDGSHLSLADMNSQSNLFDGVELLTLSACNTGVGGVGADGKEVEGLGVIAQRQGAEAVLASLWPVSDASTSQLMQSFYRLREEAAGTTKAEALRLAQLSLLHGTASTSAVSPARGTEAVPSRGEAAELPPFTPDPNAPYAHPYYWAPFVLIGNWK